MRATVFMPLALLIGCAHRPAPASGLYQIGAATASADRVMSTLYTVSVKRDAFDAATVRTVHTEGEWTEGGRDNRFDSDAQTGADPWPLRLEHAVASAPAAVRLSPEGAVTALIDEQGWRDAARDQITALDLPGAASAAAEALIDPEGLLRDLRRSFPGRPEAVWVREESLGGITAALEEACTRSREGRLTVWTCAGGAREGGVGKARLQELTTWSIVRADRRGLQSFEMGYEGDVVVLDASGVVRLKNTLMGRRLVSRAP
ncbi:MAG: hypothetical protein JXX28_11125 [Deltaproteobacteria bacterium]|nr:hypothetical protein [Deltaproteobacteria bacterium]